MNEDYLNIANPNKAFVRDLVRRIRENGGYCPSREIKTQDTKCHCKNYRENGDCICGLFLKIPCIDVTGRG